jgi:hypothetical protein
LTITPGTQKQTLSAERLVGAVGGCRTALRRWRQADGNAVPDDDSFIADADVLDDEAHDSLALYDL